MTELLFPVREQGVFLFSKIVLHLLKGSGKDFSFREKKVFGRLLC